MKRLVTLIVAAGMLFGLGAWPASAADIKVKGKFDFGFGLYSGTTFTKHDGGENFDALQRLRTQVDFIASESLKGVAFFEVGNTYWGAGGGSTWGGTAAGRGAGGAMGSDGVAVELKHLYIDWDVPQTDLQVRMGIQAFALPYAAERTDWMSGNFIFDDDAAGILLSYDFNENFGTQLGWFRPWDGAVGSDSNTPGNRFGHDDEVDLFTLTLPIEVKDAFRITPYGMFGLVGGDLSASYTGGNGFRQGLVGSWLSGNGSFGDDGKAWWAGLAFNLDYLDPFYAAFDFAYGSYSADDTASGWFNRTDPDRAGWVAIAKFGYKLDNFTPILFGWYGSGADVDGGDGMDGLLPVLSPFWGMTSFGWGQPHFGGREYNVADSPAGIWSIGTGLEDIRFLDNLTTHLRFAYFQGTSDVEEYNKAAKAGGYKDAFRDYRVLDSSDWGVEINLDNKINIYENLDMYVQLAYIHMDVEHSASDFEDNAWKSYVGFTYNF